MIETMIKRDGREEPFLAKKANGWGEWGAKTLGINWSPIVLDTIASCPRRCTTAEFHKGLIAQCLARNTWEHNRMAGRLESVMMVKEIFKSDKHPSIKEVHTRLIAAGLMVDLGYSDEEYAALEKVINHKLDLKSSHYELTQLRYKYALRDRVGATEFETPQFIYMRMAMALCADDSSDEKLMHVENFYHEFSQKRLNPPTPNFTNLGTGHGGYSSCCVYTADDTWPSLAAADHIALAMTAMSAGLGAHLVTRALKEPVRGGLIPHQGKIPYYRAQVGAKDANLQNGRGGACTMHYTAYDPEVESLNTLKNPMTPLARQVRGLDYSFGSNKKWVRAVIKNQPIKLFSPLKNRDLYEAQYSADDQKFENLYAQAEERGTLGAEVNARQITIQALTQAIEVGRHYIHFTDTLNKHTPFLETIYSSNLCQEIALVTKHFRSVEDLYKHVPEEILVFEDENGNEISLKMNQLVETQRGIIYVFSLEEGDDIVRVL